MTPARRLALAPVERGEREVAGVGFQEEGAREMPQIGPGQIPDAGDATDFPRERAIREDPGDPRQEQPPVAGDLLLQEGRPALGLEEVRRDELVEARQAPAPLSPVVSRGFDAVGQPL